MSKFFRKANREDVTRYTTPDGEEYLELRAELTKAEANKVLGNAPSGDRDIEGGLAFLEKFFHIAAVRWSMVDEKGKPVPCTVEVYREVDAAAGRWIDEQLGSHLNKVLGREVAELEGESSS